MIVHDEFARHGGALDVARRLYPLAPEPWLDLSTGINPIPFPCPDLPSTVWSRLPEATALAGVEAAAAARYRVPAGARVVAAPGTQAIIQRLPDLHGGHDVRLLGETYGEFEPVFRSEGARTRTVSTEEALAGADVAIVVNPNNPDGRLVAPEMLTTLAERVGVLVVDEAFMDALAPHRSVVPRLSSSRMIVLRSIGKFYGLAGLRLGFAIARPASADALRRMLGPWAVSAPAIVIGRAALEDETWLQRTRHRLAEDAARLAFWLKRVGAEDIGGTPLFRLFDHPAMPQIFEALARNGILARRFAARPRWLRLGLPGAEAEWMRLESALRPFR